MAGLIRSALRKLLDHELGVVGEELHALEVRNDDQAEQILSLRRRFDLLQNRVGMRLKRVMRDEGGEYDEREVLSDLARGRFPEYGER